MNERTVSMVSLALQAGIPIIVVGPSGAAKSSILRAMAQKLERHLEIVRITGKLPGDLGGAMQVVGEETVLRPPAWAKRLQQQNGGVLLLEDIHNAMPSVQGELSQIFLDRVAGEFELPPSTNVIGTANPAQARYAAHDFIAMLANRCVHIDWKDDVRLHAQGLVEGFTVPKFPVLPENWRSWEVMSRTVVAQFELANPTLIRQEPENVSEAGKAWPSPRTWEYVAILLAACQAAYQADEQMKEIVERGLVEGCVGEAAASMLFSYMADLDLPNPEAVLADPSSWNVANDISRPDRIYTVLSGILSIVKLENTAQRWTRAWKVVEKVREAGPADMAAFIARHLLNIRPSSDVPTPKEATAFLELISRNDLS